MIKNILIFTFIIVGLMKVSAQVGIDVSNPNPNAHLQIESTTKGFLLPRMTTFERFALLSNCSSSAICPDGLIVFDTDKQTFFYLISNAWYMISPWVAPDLTNGVNENLTQSTIIKNLGINTAPALGMKLDVNGNTNIAGRLDVTTDLNITGSTTVSNGNVEITTGGLSVGGNITAAGRVTCSNFTSDGVTMNASGPVPKGGIILWSGALGSIPAGYSLCDGSNGTPDLSGRFVLSPGSRSNSIANDDLNTGSDGSMSFSTYDVGGFDAIEIAVSEMPAHLHAYTSSISPKHSHVTVCSEGGDFTTGANYIERYKGYGDNDSYSLKGPVGNTPGSYTHITSRSGAHTHTLLSKGDAGGNQPHTNLPPYYVLAFIMKI